MVYAIFSSYSLYINFRKQTIEGHCYTVCIIYIKDYILLNSSDFAYKRPLDSTKDSTEYGNGQEGAIKDMYNILLKRSNNYLKDLIKKKEDNNKIQNKEESVWKETIKKQVYLLQQDDKLD